MNRVIQKILNKIEANGYEAYIVGGYVRDYILGIETFDVDICTNALPKDIIKIFNIKSSSPTYGSISLVEGKYNFDITTYRSESLYSNRHPQKIEYVDNLITDIKRRDFTINSLCMNSHGNIIDLLNGKEDILNRKIRVIGNVEQKLTEDPLRILRAIRFSIVLNFSLDEEIINFINIHKDLLKTLSYNRKKIELERILVSKNAESGLKILKDYDLMNILEINYDKIVVIPDILGMWAQIEFSPNYPFTSSSLDIIKSIRSILSIGVINNCIIYKYGLYTSLVAGEILGYSKNTINEIYNKLPIKTQKDLMLNSKDIIDILQISPSSKIKDILDDLIEQVLTGKLNNNNEELKEYILNKWK